MNTKILKSLGAAAALAALVGCQTADWAHKNDGRTANEAVNDSRITSMIKTELNNEPVYKFSDVNVQTFAGIVQLSGFVDSDQQKSRAADIAQHVQGVTRVENGLTVKPNPTGRANNMGVNNGLNAAPSPTTTSNPNYSNTLTNSTTR